MLIRNDTAVRNTTFSPGPAQPAATAGSGFQAALSAAAQTGATEVRADDQPPTTHWTNDGLASIIGDRDGAVIPKDPINWDSKGDRELTAEDIARLKEKYDVDRLSSQQYYDLLSDLTQLGALSGEDCMDAHSVRFQGPTVLFIPHDEKFSQLRWNRNRTGSPPGILSDGVDILMEHLAWTRSEQSRVMNPSITTAEWTQYRDGIQRNIQARQRLMALMDQLR